MSNPNAPAPAERSHWICPAYGIPTGTSEISRTAGYYSAAALIVCSYRLPAQPAAAAA